MARERSKRSKRSRGGAGFGRALSLIAFLPIASRIPMYTRLITSLVMDDRMPASRKAMLAGAAGYLVIGRDLIPDDLPIIGGLDDLIVVVLAAEFFLDGVPDALLDEKLAELGIDRAEFDRDVAQVRRLTPSPVRRTIRRVPELIGGVGEAMKTFGLGPRTRAWINREDRNA
ncbi:MAG TPA: YkvA family protein [Candidatus Limnocylindrales bacterium]